MPPKLGVSIRRQPNGVNMSPKLSVEHQEAGFACRRDPVRGGAGCAGLRRALARNTEKWDIRRSHISHFKECWR